MISDKGQAKETNTLYDSQLPVPIESRIFSIRGTQVILDKDLAELYGVQTFRMNEQIKRNIRRFPESFRFQLTRTEMDELIASCDRLNVLKHRSSCPYVFTEQGVAMLSAVLHSDVAIEISIKIMNAFVAFRRFFLSNAQLFQRIEQIEHKQMETDNKIGLLFDKIEAHAVIPKQHIFYDGQVFDAYIFVSNLIRNANSRILLIDNYVDETVLTLLDKRKEKVQALIYTKDISKQFQLDINKHNTQYASIDVKLFNKTHDRFLIIDEKVYHFGASIKDIGKKWFAVSLMKDISPKELIDKL